MPRPWIQEEPLDRILFRPLAKGIVRLAAPTSITPNQVTLVAGVCGVAAGAAIALGTVTSLLAAAACLFLQSVLDCADGELARLRGGGGRAGQVIDGIADYVVSIAVHLGLILLAFRSPQFASSPPATIVVVVILAGLSMAFHAALFDAAKQRFRLQTGAGAPWMDPTETVRNEVAEAKGVGKRAILRLYQGYAATQHSFARWVRPKGDISQGLFLAWTLLGPTTRLAVVTGTILASIWAPRALLVYPAFGLLFGNLCWAALIVYGRLTTPRPAYADPPGSDSPSPRRPGNRSPSRVGRPHR